TRPRFVVSFTLPAFEFFEAVELTLSINGGVPRNLPAVTASPAYIEIKEAGTYAITLKIRSRAKRLSTGVTISPVSAGKTTPPANVIAVYASQRGEAAFVEWIPPL